MGGRPPIRTYTMPLPLAISSCTNTNTYTQVEFEVQETFQLVVPGATMPGEVPEEEEAAAMATRQHYFTFESDFLRGTEPEWQVRGLVLI